MFRDMHRGFRSHCDYPEIWSLLQMHSASTGQSGDSVNSMNQYFGANNRHGYVIMISQLSEFC